MTVQLRANPEQKAITPQLDEVSNRLVTARISAEALERFPGQLPDTLTGAYLIQSASISRWQDEIAGWKVGMVPEEFRERLNAERLAGPIFKSSIAKIDHQGNGSMPIFSGGFAAVEAEFVFRFGETIEPTSRAFTDQELTELVSALHIGAEIASSPMADVNKLGPCCVVSDFGNNAGLLVGPEVPNWSELPDESLTATVTVDDEIVGTANASAIHGGLLQVLRYLIGLCAERGLEIKKGTLVSTGALTGIHEVTSNSKAQVNFGPLGSFSVEFKPMQPRK